MIKDNLAWAFLLTIPLTGPVIILGLQDQWQSWKLKKIVELVVNMTADELRDNYIKAISGKFNVLFRHKYLPFKFKLSNETWVYILVNVAREKGADLHE